MKIAVVGAGAIGGYAIIYVLDRYKLIHVPIDVYQISYVPFILQPLDSAVHFCGVDAIGYPAICRWSMNGHRVPPECKNPRKTGR